MVTGGNDQLAAAKGGESDLYGAFGKSGRLRKRSQARGHWFPLRPRGQAVKIQINQIRSWLLIVSDQIAHQHVQNVIVNGNGLFKAMHRESS